MLGVLYQGTESQPVRLLIDTAEPVGPSHSVWASYGSIFVAEENNAEPCCSSEVGTCEYSHRFAAIGAPRPCCMFAMLFALFFTLAPPNESMSRIGMLFPTNKPSPALRKDL